MTAPCSPLSRPRALRLLVVAARPPVEDGKGDQLRLARLLPRLASGNAVTLVYPAARRAQRPPATTPAGLVERPVHVSLRARGAAAVAGWLAGRPGQAGWFAPRAVRRAVRQAASSHDLALFVTARAYTDVGRRPYVIDHIDALSANALKRSGTYRLPILRWLWRAESRRLARWERRIAAGAAAQIVVSPGDAEALPSLPQPSLIPTGVISDGGRAQPAAARDIDVLLTGNMRYPPNRDAAAWLASEIAPGLRARRGAVRVVVAGRDAASLRLSGDVEAVSDVPDLGPYLRRAKVAVAPLRVGTGVPTKVLEAAQAGAAVVITPDANTGLGFPDDAVGLAADTPAFVAEIARLLESESLRRSRVAALSRELRRFDLERFAERYEGVLLAAAARAADRDRRAA